MKRSRIYLFGSVALIFVLLSVPLYAQELKPKKEKSPVWYGKWPILGVRVGTDIGGALPFPFKYIPSEFAPAIKPKLTLGGEVIFPVSKRFAIASEVNFKTVAIDADAFVEDQRFQDGDLLIYFTGMATMNMSFSMMEIPLYVKYSFSGGRNRVMLGGYYSSARNQAFETVAKKGFIRPTKETEELEVLNSDLIMSFTNELDKWDYGIVFGYERYIIDNLLVNAKVNIGLKSIFTPGFEMLDYKMYQMRLAVGLSYELVNFNKKYNLKRYIPSFKKKEKKSDGKDGDRV